jgi:amino acid transporter
MELSTAAQLLLQGIYYVLVGFLALFSIFGVYILLRYGRTVSIAGLVSIGYTIFFTVALLSSYASLRAIISL